MSYYVYVYIGVAYGDLMKFIKESEYLFTEYQPINVVNPYTSVHTQSTNNNRYLCMYINGYVYAYI
jgi:hypothetical protein